MASQPEAKLQKKIQDALREKYGDELWIFKVHGGPYQKAGVPDLVGCYQGRFFAIEVKIPGNVPTELQRKTIEKINQAEGDATWVTSVDAALEWFEATFV